MQRLCKENRIEGVLNINRVWLIPKSSKSPLISGERLQIMENRILLLEDDVSLIDGLQYSLKKKWLRCRFCPFCAGNSNLFI